jgi:hypothetical protein
LKFRQEEKGQLTSFFIIGNTMNSIECVSEEAKSLDNPIAHFRRCLFRVVNPRDFIDYQAYLKGVFSGDDLILPAKPGAFAAWDEDTTTSGSAMGADTASEGALNSGTSGASFSGAADGMGGDDASADNGAYAGGSFAGSSAHL